MDLNARFGEGVDELDGGGEVGLGSGEDVAAGIAEVRLLHGLIEFGGGGGGLGAGGAGGRLVLSDEGFDGVDLGRGGGPGVFAAAVNGVFAHFPDVIEERFAIAGGEIEDGAVGGDRVIDGLAVVPLLGCDGEGLVAGGELAIGDEGDFHGGGGADDFGEEADHIVEVGGGAETAVVPGGVIGAAAHGGAGFIFLDEAGVHGGTDQVDGGDDERIEVVVEGIAERGGEDDGAEGSGLMVVVHDLREPFDEELAVHVDGLAEVGHVEVAIVIVAGVFFVQTRGTVHDAFFGDGFAHVPLADEVVAIGIGMDAENDDVLKDAHGFGVGSAGELPDGLDELVGADGFGGMETAIDPDDGFAFGGEGTSLFFG